MEQKIVFESYMCMYTYMYVHIIIQFVTLKALISTSLAALAPSQGGRVWNGVITRVVLFPRNPGEHECSNFVAAT